jgi:superfamily II DNA/RNA helicase
MKFKDYKLDKDLLLAINKMGYKETLEVQEKVIPNILKKKDVIIKSKTGSGKTASFLIPIMNDIEFEDNKPSALILTPTRELAIQIKEVASNLGVYKKLKTVAIYGRAPFKDQITDLKQRTHLVSGSIGRVLDMIERGHLDLSHVRYVVIDEADEMFKMGFIEKLTQILSYIPNDHTTVLCSATFNHRILEIQDNYMKLDHEFVEIESEAPKIDQKFYKVTEDEKMMYLDTILANLDVESAIVFSNLQVTVNSIFDHLARKGVAVTMIHGGLDQKDRIYNLNDFSKGEFRILVATDIAARGLDIDEVGHIINFDMPTDKDLYTHRIGRSARVDNTGVAVSFVTKNDTDLLKKLGKETTEFEFDFESRKNLNKLSSSLTNKIDKFAGIKSTVFKVYMNGGKSKKIRPTNIVAAICDIDGVLAEDIGVISVQDNQSYVDILNGKGKLVIDGLRKSGVKGKPLKIQEANK